MPYDVILKLNERAAKDKTPMPKEPVFQYRGKDVNVPIDRTRVPEPAEHIMREPDLVLNQIGVEDGVMSELDERPAVVGSTVGVENEAEVPSEEPEPVPDEENSAFTVVLDEPTQGLDFEEQYEERGSALDEAEVVTSVDTDPEPSVSEPVRRSRRNHLPVDYKALHRRGFEGARLARSTYYTVAVENVRRSDRLTRCARTDSSKCAYHITVKEALKRMPKAAIKSIVK